jgi:anaerobic magnesium-protoporphyrin IX monomethyl ester cyclase
MAKVLLISPSTWGRGITPIWVVSHTACLKGRGHQVELFDCTFYEQWSVNEIKFNTENKQYRPSEYESFITMKTEDIFEAAQKKVAEFKPDIIFWSAISSHIHGEGEYSNIQNGFDLISKLDITALKVTSGLQPTASPELMFEKFAGVDYFIRGESEFVLCDVADSLDEDENIKSIKGVAYKENGKVKCNPRQDIISNLDDIPFYDYSLFEDQLFFRPFNGKVVRAVDYELSRGCPYTCTYCVETVIQKYYGFSEISKNGVLSNAKQYLRNKSGQRIFSEIKTIHEKFGVTYFRCQDTNFLTIKRRVLNELADLIDSSGLDIFLYIETRPESISSSIIPLLKKLRVKGVGMGVEMASEGFRKSKLNRFPSQEKILKAFKILKEAGILRTAYNMIGLADETEEMILDTIRFNQELELDNITVAYYSPYLGTIEQEKSAEQKSFQDYEYNVDGQLRTMTKSTDISKELLTFYKKHFTSLVREGLENLEKLKTTEGLKS